MKTIKIDIINRFVLILAACFLSQVSSGQDLESYIQEAQQNNPDIQAVELRYNIAEEKVNESNTLPNTEVSAGYFISEPETRTGAQKARFSVKQMIPWFGTFSAREEYATSMAEADYVKLAISKRKLALSISEKYYQLYALQAKQTILDENIELLKTYEELALTSVEVANASAVDVLKLQIRQNELLQKKEVLQQAFIAKQSDFNTLLNKNKEASVTVVDSLFLPSKKMTSEVGNLNLHPELLQYDKLYESVASSEELNQKELQPNLGVGLDYIPVAERPDMNFTDNGKDIVMPMVSVSIPIFNSKYKSISKQNKLKQQEIKAQKEEQQNKLENALKATQSKLETARITYNTQQKNLQQAKDAEEILIKNYETGTIDFNDVLDIQELQLKFQLEQIEAIKEYYVQSANINYLTN
ncbi:TolC family protein [Marixanthomonas ophiurae]|uniref:TolC family protein n=1 Tax=Marixanthomonas ophiurae TaxID=387659 RepID=A0A3E1QCR7_9FLAO|nr:TolC family protein [Marixanthomonas ophiurae]RFN59949.1 TolC family protein [Marixanthomonas ophiurae]